VEGYGTNRGTARRPTETPTTNSKSDMEQCAFTGSYQNNKTLKPDECYDAVKDGDHTLYFMVPSPQTEVEKDSERTLLLLPPLPDFPTPIFQSHFAVPQKMVKRAKRKLVGRVSNHGKFKASLQTEVERGGDLLRRRLDCSTSEFPSSSSREPTFGARRADTARAQTGRCYVYSFI
jgi:hypothetical protein